MTTIPFAEQRLTDKNFTENTVARPPRGMVLHIAQGTYEGTINWAKNPNAEVSYYAVVGPEGEIAQVVDLDDKAWTQGSGNREWIGVEFAGFVPQALFPDQVDAAAKLLAWLHETYGVPLQITDDPTNGHGLAYHGLGQHVGWGHPECPGPSIVAQRAEIVTKARALVDGLAPPIAPTNPPNVRTKINMADSIQEDVTRTLDLAGNGYFDLPSVKAKDVHSFNVIAGDDPAVTGKYPISPDLRLTIATGSGWARIVMTGGKGRQKVTVRVIHS